MNPSITSWLQNHVDVHVPVFKVYVFYAASSQTTWDDD